ncbi:MAG: chitobiase/beta-hexosaminidase C-terminal domain-containing protein [Actinobacteria bacterium]|nr:chitobiase/beta-hexosaminidase C-terminal domain-containing protein [Actinomycetota bacterium]
MRRSFLLLFACLIGTLLAPAVAAAGPTIVSLTFDDGTADQYTTRTALAQNSLHATFFVNSNLIGSSSSFMTWDQLSGLSADGNEITGHTLDHVDLTSVSTTEATRQVCDDRQALISRGFSVTDFAYPYGASNSTVESIVRGCGYKSARRAWGLCTVGLMPPNCNDVVAEPVPPRNTWGIASAGVHAVNTLADIEGAVTRAENAGGGWVVLLFHHVCDGCDPVNGNSVSPAIFSAFTDWLAPRLASRTYVRTMSDVMGDTTPPTSSIACNGSSCSGWFSQPVSVSLSATDTGTAVTAIRYTTDGSDPTAASALYTGPFTISATATVKYRAWDMAGNVETTKSQLLQFDSAPPVSSITCNSTVCSSSAYAAPVSVSLSATDTGGSGGVQIHYETNGSDPTIFSPLYVASFTVSTTTTVKYRAWDSAGNAEATNSQLIQISTAPPDTTAPTSTIACNGAACTSGWYAPSVSVSLSASDPDDAVAAIRYTRDGSDPTSSSTLYSGAFGVSTTTTVKYRAWDSVGNVEATKSQLIQVDTVAPTVSITSPVNGATVTGNIKIIATVADAQTGVASVAYYVDGVLLGTLTSSPWQIPWNTKRASSGQHVLTAVATDRAGNRTTSAAVTVTVR